jgi:hypothetical protein
MRLTRLPAAFVAAALMAGMTACATTITGTGSIAADVVTNGPTPSADAGDPSESTDPDDGDDQGGSASPSPSEPSPTVNSVQVRERALCVLERAAITTINTTFNKAKQRTQQVQILKQGAATIAGQVSRSGLPTSDTVLRAGKGVQTQLSKLSAAASAGQSPSTGPYNTATQNFQKVCNAIP